MKNSGNKPKVIFIGRFNKSEILSGPEKFAKRISQKHSEHNKTIFIEYFFEGKIYGLKEKLFGKILENYRSILILRLGLFRLFFELLTLRPGIIHITSFERFAVICLLYKIFCDVKIIYESHGIIRYENKELKTVSYLYRIKDIICEKLYLSFSDIIIFKSETAKNLCCKYYEIKNSKIKFIPNGIDEEFGIVKRKSGSNRLSAAIIADKAGAQTGLKYLEAYLYKAGSNIEITVIGKSELNEKLFDKYGLKSIERLDTKKFADFLSATDIFFSINLYDTFSISAAEAMASGCITIVTKQSGISPLISNGVNGYTVNYYDVKGLGNYLSNILNNQELRVNISSQSRNVYNLLNWNLIYKNYETLYQLLL